MKLTKFLFLIALLSMFGNVQSAQLRLSKQAEIAVMTMGPYQEELYSAFGHTAIRVHDPVKNIDWVYNYGVFDFDQENFYWNFARGKLLYQLGLSRYERFKNHYIRENRYIVEQYLNLTQEEKQKVFDFLTENYKPENREYYYNYVYDNCSSKIPEILKKIFPGRIQYSYDYTTPGTTIRDLMDQYLAYQPWGDLIIDIGLGYQVDKEASPEIYMFLPDYVMAALDGATFERDTGVVPLVKETIKVYEPVEEQHSNGILTPFNTFVLLFFMVGFFTNRDFKRGKRSHWLDVILFSVVGLVGWWLVFLWVGTDHLSKYNMNLLWAIPFHLPLVFFLNKKALQPFLSAYFLTTGILYVVLLIVWEFLPQPLHIALIPLVITMILRCFYIRYDLRQQLRKTTRQ